MKKSEIHARMTDYVEGELSLSERALVDAHLDANPEMRREVEELGQIVDLLRGLPDEPSPMGLADAVMERIREGEGKPPLWVRARRAVAAGGAVSWAVPAFAATAVAAVAILRGDLVVPGLTPAGPAGELASQTPAPAAVVARAPAASEASSQLSDESNSVAAAEPGGVPSLVAKRAADGSPLIGAGAAPDDALPTTPEAVEPVEVDEATRLAAKPSEAAPPPTAEPVEPAQPAQPEQVASATSTAPTVRVQPASSASLAAPVTGPTGPAGADFVVNVGGEVSLPVEAEDDAQRGEQQLDRRLDLLLESPARFMQELQGDSVAAQELWLGELAARAVERNIDARVVAALENSGDVEALSVAEFFQEAVEQARSDTIASEAPAP